MSQQFANTQNTTITTSSAETTIVTADPNTENLLCGLFISVTTALLGTMTLRDATGAPVARLVLDYPTTAVTPVVPLALAFVPPLKQSSKNSSWTIQASVAQSYKVAASFITEE
jgi:hypothetical protein